MPGKRKELSRLSAEEELLQKQEEKLRQREKEMQKRLLKLPALLQEQQRQNLERRRAEARNGGEVISPRRPRSGSPAPRGPTRKRARAEQIKTIALLVVFALIIMLVLKAIPAG